MPALNLDSDMWVDAVLAMSASQSSPMTPTQDPLEFWKEICHEGEFVQERPGGRVKFRITPRMMDHWKSTFVRMAQDGTDVPVPVEHTKDPEKRRGSIKEMKRGVNSRGHQALYARIRFRDADAAKLSASGVSIYVPASRPDGKGGEYRFPVEHVAITDYPVISGLEPFQAIVASLVEAQEDDDMTLRELATQAGVDPSITDEQQLLLALSQVITKLKAPAGPPKPPGPPRPPFAGSLGDGDEEDDTDPQPQQQPLTGALLSMVRRSRAGDLDRLSKGPDARITPATRKKLEERFMTDEVLSLSHVQDDGFDHMVQALEQNPPIRSAGRTGPQAGVVALSSSLDPKSNPLLADAERRAQEAAGARQAG